MLAVPEMKSLRPTAMARLKELAGRLKKFRVAFPGYVSGARKQAFLDLADLYIFPSRHESYGLTLMEALASGLPRCTPASTAALASVVASEISPLTASMQRFRLFLISLKSPL